MGDRWQPIYIVKEQVHLAPTNSLTNDPTCEPPIWGGYALQRSQAEAMNRTIDQCKPGTIGENPNTAWPTWYDARALHTISTMCRTTRDNPNNAPHRGIYHTRCRRRTREYPWAWLSAWFIREFLWIVCAYPMNEGWQRQCHLLPAWILGVNPWA